MTQKQHGHDSLLNKLMMGQLPGTDLKESQAFIKRPNYLDV